MKKKAAITMLALGMLIFLGAQPQMPHYEFLNGPWSARKIIDMGHCYVDGGPPYSPPVIYVVNEDTCIVKTTDDGLTWEILHKGHNFEDSVKCVAVHPSDPNIVYKGVTGSIYETGIMRSSDGGYFWIRINNGLPDEVHPSKLGIFRQNPDYLLLGTYIAPGQTDDRCLFKTTDGGDSWEYYSPPWHPNRLNITDFSFHPTAPNIVCFSASHSTPDNAYRGVWKSEDFGETWTHIGRPDNMSYPEITCVAMVDENIIYAGYWNKEKNEGGIQMATKGGHKWQVLPIILDNDLINIYIDSNEANIFYLVINSDKGIKILKYNISEILRTDKSKRTIITK